MKNTLWATFCFAVILMDAKKVMDTGELYWLILFGVQVAVTVAWLQLLFWGRKQKKVDEAFGAVVIETKKLIDIYDRERAALHAYIAELQEQKETANADHE